MKEMVNLTDLQIQEKVKISDHLACSDSRPMFIKKFSPNSIEHEISTAHKIPTNELSCFKSLRC